MPLARIITRAVEQSQELAADLRGRGFEVEIVSPADTPKTRADVELRLEECTPEEALIRAGVLPETNDMAVFIAPGAIANRRERLTVPMAPQFPVQRKWYEAIPDATTPEVLPFELQPQAELKAGALDSPAPPKLASIALDQSAWQAPRMRDEIVSREIGNPEIVDKEEDEPLFATAGPDESAVPAPKPMEAFVAAPVPIGVEQPVVETSFVAKQETARIEPKRWPAPRKIPELASVRRVRIPALGGTSPWVVSKTAAGFAAIAVLVLIMGAWIFRRAPIPAELGSSGEDAHQAVPFTEVRNKPAPASAQKPDPSAPTAAEPVDADASSLVPQAAAAVTPSSSPRARSSKRAAVSSQGSDNVAKDTVTRFHAPAATTPPKPKPQAANQSSDGIKRYSDLD